MATQRCRTCKKKKPKTSFSINQLKKPTRQRRCRKCTNHDQARIKQRSETPNFNDEEAFNETMNLLKQRGLTITPIEHNHTLLQRLHNHCLNKSIFTEIYFAIKINNRHQSAASHALVSIFRKFPDTFTYRNRVIIASNDPSHQHSIYLSITKYVPLKIEKNLTRSLFPELVYRNGKISCDGVTLYEGKSIHNTDISELFDDPKIDRIVHHTGDKGEALGLNAEEHRNFKNCNATIKKSSKIKRNRNNKRSVMQSQNARNIKQNADSLFEYQEQLKQCKNTLNSLKQQLDDKQEKLKIFDTNKIMSKWNGISHQLYSNGNQIFDQNQLEKIVNILNKLPIHMDCKIDTKRGHGSHIILSINTKIITISKQMTNKHFIKALDEKLDYYTKKMKHEMNANDLKSQIQSGEEKKSEIVTRITNEENGLELLISEYTLSIERHAIAVRKAERAFSECLHKIAALIEDRISRFEEYVATIEHEFWNMELAPNKLILVRETITKEPYFIQHVMESKQEIMRWIAQNVHKYKEIEVYGERCLWLRFINFLMNTAVVWWIEVLRCLTLPVTISNLNGLMIHSRRAVREYFCYLPMPKKEVDIVMVITYFMNEAKPFQFEYTKARGSALCIETYAEWENEEQMIDFCNECFNYTIQNIPNYRESTSYERMNKQIETYMQANQNSPEGF
eukprot:324816_1